MRGLLPLMVWGILLNSGPIYSRPNSPEVERVRQGLERILRDNIMPFWSPKALVREGDGYRLHHDANGAWLGATDKGLIDQARTLWLPTCIMPGMEPKPICVLPSTDFLFCAMR